MLQVGQRAPEIDALASDGSRFVLSQQRGLCTVVYFFPKAFTPGCTNETKRFRDNHTELALVGATIVGVSTDDRKTQCRFSEALKAPFPMIGDGDRSICKAWGVLWPIVRLARRVTFVVAPDMTIEAVFRHEIDIKAHRDDVLAYVDARFRARRQAELTAPGPPLLTPSRPVPATDAKTGADALLGMASALPAKPEAKAETGPPQRSLVIAGRFEIERRAASGASGDIYRARDQLTGAAVAVKLLRAGPHRDDARFEREARILAELRHPGILWYVAHGVEPSGEAYLVTEWLEGESLARRLVREPLALGESVTLGLRIASALGAAHARGVVHRDLKPSNLFLPGGVIEQVKLLDFGVSRPSLADNPLTVPGDVIGTPGYMAPEQARGSRDVDARADVFSLGCVLFKCLTGRAAFTGEDMVALLMGVLGEEVPRVRDLNPAAPEALSDLVARMLSKTPAGRPADGNAVAEELAPLAPRAEAP